MRAWFILALALILSGCGSMEHDQQAVLSSEVMQMQKLNISSPAFWNNGKIPSKYACDGDDISPAITIADIPDAAKSLVLIMDDPDAPSGTWDHWIMWNIPVGQAIAENSHPGVQGKNSWGRNDYGGPCPPSGTHRYFFRVYALDIMLDLGADSGKKDLEKAMDGHIIADGELIGLYSRE